MAERTEKRKGSFVSFRCFGLSSSSSPKRRLGERRSGRWGFGSCEKALGAVEARSAGLRPGIRVGRDSAEPLRVPAISSAAASATVEALVTARRAAQGSWPLGGSGRNWWVFPTRVVALSAVLLGLLLLSSCGRPGERDASGVPDPHLATNGTIEVTARLVEIPEGAIFKRDLYNYAAILKYEVLQVHRGEVTGEMLFVGHYNPWKPRAEAADARVPEVGGNLKRFEAGQVHHMALEVPIDDYFMGGLVNKYFGQDTGALYWAVWTDLERD